ncbi:hypothetical protein T492DRAFT_857952 [Pavlovales sp. CCMP2436]|nr:hypothetical protein T492DRAFT_857952 [Pavlovales sp. CCMP2436]
MHVTPSASARSDALAATSLLLFMHATPSASARSDALEALSVTCTLSQLHAPPSLARSRSCTHFAVTGSLCRHRHALAAARSDAPAIQPQILSKVQPLIRSKMQPHILFKDQSSRSWRHRKDSFIVSNLAPPLGLAHAITCGTVKRATRSGQYAWRARVRATCLWPIP